MSRPINAAAKWLARTRIQAADAAVKASQQDVANLLQPLTRIGRLSRTQLSQTPFDFDRCYHGPNRLGFWITDGRVNAAPSAIVLSMSGGKLEAYDEGWDTGTLQLHASELRYARRKMVLAEHLPAAGVTLHALGRWYERQGEATNEALVRDILDLALWTCPALVAANIMRTDPHEIIEFMVPCPSGVWVGRMIPAVVKASEGKTYNRYVLSATTFVDSGLTTPTQDKIRAAARSLLDQLRPQAIELMLVRFCEREVERDSLRDHPLVHAARTMVRVGRSLEAVSVS